ncbi:MAG: methyltransferase domain-containing protein [Acidobacteria bacterium]|nr:methyltransferase domain-containing protein [Acidobacteriota bacterium]
MSLPADSYGAFARVYDRALGDLFMRGAAAVLRALESEYPTETRTHLDVACGTGLAMRHFAARGYATRGIDASYAMASRARRRGLDVVVSDVRTSVVRARFERVTCLYDSLNHLLERGDLARAFASVASVMGESSLFWFDLNHPESYREVWAMAEPFESGDAVYNLEIDTHYDEAANLATARVRGWHTDAGVRHTIDETHYQRAWERDEVVEILRDAGLETVDVFCFDPFAAKVFGGIEVKEMYVARRKAE